MYLVNLKPFYNAIPVINMIAMEGNCIVSIFILHLTNHTPVNQGNGGRLALDRR